VRVSALVLLAHHYGPQILDTKLHELTGLAAFVVVVLIALFAIAGREVLPDPNARPVDTPVSTRFTTPLTLLCCAALVPVALNSYAGRRRDDCTHPQALIPGPGIDDPVLRAKRERAVQQEFEGFAFREGVVRGTPALSYSIIRTWDPKRVYYRPEYWLSGHAEASSIEIETLDAGGRSIPIHRVGFAPRAGELRLAAYLLVYRGEPIAHAMREQILAAPSLMLHGARPMTLYYAQASSSLEDAERTQQALARWLASSWKQYDTICNAGR
jgi:hypothetical protein